MIERSATAWNWIFNDDPDRAEGKLFIFLRMWLILFEAGWIIYGSTFVFSSLVDECEETAKKEEID